MYLTYITLTITEIAFRLLRTYNPLLSIGVSSEGAIRAAVRIRIATIIA